MRLRSAAAALMAVALASAPGYALRFHVGPLPTTLLEAVLLPAVVLGVIALRGGLPWRSTLALPGAALLVAATIGVFVSPDLRGALGEWKAFFVEPIAAGLVIAGLAAERRHAWLLLGGLGAGALAAAVVNLGVDAPRILSGRISLATPPVAIYQSANQLALYLVPLDAVALAVLLFGAGRAPRSAAAAFLAFTVPAVLLTYSRGGILALAMAVFLLALVHPRRLVLAPALVLVLGLGVGLVPGIRRRVAIELDLKDPANTVTPRLGLWRATLRLLESRPLTGAGLHGYGGAIAPYYRNPFHVAFPHDIVLNFWAETGLLGVLAFGWLTAAGVLAAVRGLAADPFARALSAGLLGFLLAIWVHGLVDVPYFKNDLALAFWAMLGLHSGVVGRVMFR